MEALTQNGASEEEKEQIIQAHDREVNNLLNKLDADKLRMQSTLSDRLKQKRENKLRQKQKQVTSHVEDAKRQLAENQKAQNSQLKADEVCNKYIT